MASGITKFIQRVCVQDAVYWGAPVSNGYGGYTYNQPKLIKCRWTDTTKNITTDSGELIVSRAEVLVVDDLEVGGVLYLGDFTGLTNTHRVNPLTLDAAYTIKRVDKTPLFRSTDEFVRVVYL